MAENEAKSETAKREEGVLAFWREHAIFEKSLQKDAPKGEFTFYEGPPTANAGPALHHLEARAFKDAFPRYKTMRGYRVARRAGWDTHGLPVELQIEKALGFSGKPDIEKYGIAAFNKKCKESVLEYIDLWRKFSERVGYWVDLDKAYFTFDASYMESLWHIVKKVSDDGRLVKDYKVLPWCARCGTALSSHELAQGYEDVKDLAVTAKFKVKPTQKLFDLGLGQEVYLLAWTTTPWTLPGNVALALGPDIRYRAVQYEPGKYYLVAKDRVSALNLNDSNSGYEFSGRDLLDLEYEPLFDVLELKSDKSYKVYAADFVTTEDGTGIVHTAVMYGADDFTLGSQVGLPKVHTVGADGKFLPNTPEYLAGRFVKDENVAVDIVKDLAHRGLLFHKEKYEHSYPHCWRCKTPLIYYARDSWYVRMTDLRDELLSENNKIHWEPEYIKEGRMGEWLAGVKDWAISRERYWGTPLPVWEAEGGEKLVIGSVDELKKYAKKSGNRYFVMRHAEAEHNVKNVMDGKPNTVGLTERGIEQAKNTAAALAQKPTIIYTSPFRRTKETAQYVAEALGLSTSAIVVDERLRELDLGEYDGKPLADFVAWRERSGYADKLPGGESYQDAKNRFGAWLYEIEQKHANETILIMTHGIGFESLQVVVEGKDAAASKDYIDNLEIATADVAELPFAPLPVNDNFELDLHRPYIDAVVLEKDGKEFRRVKEVMDVWFDSGAMPFAQDHYPFGKKDVAYPADYICEAIDQTRGWFYTLLAVGVLMGRGASYKNVISLGHLLDAEGKKMSKSRGNIVDPWQAMERWGADTLRFWMYHVNQPGDSKNFDEKTVREASRVISWLDNSAKFYELVKSERSDNGEMRVIDRWIVARANETVRSVTTAMDAYRPYEATRSLASLIEDLSQWYVRGIRERAKEGDMAAIVTLRAVLKTCALLIAPFAPFVAEDVYRRVRTEDMPESVHLADWPEANEPNAQLLTKMVIVRAMVSKVLEARDKAGIKVRQPLAKLTIKNVGLSDELLDVIRNEVNVKGVVQTDAENDVELDTNITPELKEEGVVRETIRAVQDARKKAGLQPGERGSVTISVTERAIVEKHLADISAQTNTDITLS